MDWEGAQLEGQDLNGKRPTRLPIWGGLRAESRDVFPNLTVHQNLMLGQKAAARTAAGRLTTCTMFPASRKRQHTEAGVMSGASSRC